MMAKRWTLAVLVGVVVAAVAGLLALILSPVAPELSAAVFAVTALPFGITLGWVTAVAPKSIPRRARPEDSVENTWITAALAGAATDVAVVAGLGLAVVSVTRAEMPAQLLLLAVLLVLFASASARYTFSRIRTRGA